MTQENTGGKKKKRLLNEKCKESQGYFARLPKDVIREISIKGGKKGGPISKPYTYSRCIDCKIKLMCNYAFREYGEKQRKAEEEEACGNPNNCNLDDLRNFPKEKSRCWYEVCKKPEDRAKMLETYQAFVGNNPDKLLGEISEVYNMMKDCVREDPNYGRVQGLYYALTKLYTLKYGDTAAQILIQNSVGNSNSPSKDIKEIMAEIRKDKTVETETGHETTSMSVKKSVVSVSDSESYDEEEGAEGEGVAKIVEVGSE